MNKKIYKGYELIEAIANGKIENYTKIIPHYPNDNCTAEYFEYAHGFIKVCYKDGCYRDSKYDNDVNVCIFLDNNRSFEILEDNTEEIEELNAYKLMESPYMANLLKEQRYDKFMELLKQSEVEIADKLIKLTWAINEIRKEKSNE